MPSSSKEQARRLKRAIVGLLDTMNIDDLDRVLAALRRILTNRAPPPPPLSAPELFQDRPAGETVIAFINRVYSYWLTGHFTRADLARLDRKCEKALRDWEYRHKKISPA